MCGRGNIEDKIEWLKGRECRIMLQDGDQISHQSQKILSKSSFTIKNKERWLRDHTKKECPISFKK